MCNSGEYDAQQMARKLDGHPMQHNTLVMAATFKLMREKLAALRPGRDEEAIRAEERERCASEIERRNWPCVGDARRIAADLRSLKTERGS
jgi:hypothetical protein